MAVKAKVLFVASVPEHITGFHLPYLKMLAEQGYEVHVAYNGDIVVPYADKVWNVPISRKPFAFSNIASLIKLKAIIEAENYVLVHCHTPVASILTRMASVKNHKFSLDIANELNKRNINFCLVFAGRGELESEIKLAATNSGFVDKIHFLGIRSDIPEIMAGSDVMLMPSLYEGFPVVLVESQAVGLPSIISDSIAKEVDLGVGLIDFQSLDAPFGTWLAKIMDSVSRDKLSNTERVSIIASKGFDSHTNVKTLEALYARENA